MEFYESRWKFLAWLFWPLAGSVIVVVVEGTDLLLAPNRGLLAKGAALLGLLVVIVAILRTIRPALVIRIEPSQISLRCRPHARGWLSRYRLRSFDFGAVDKVTIGLRTDIPITSSSESLTSAYFLLETCDPQSVDGPFSYSPVNRICGWRSLVQDLQEHPILGKKVTIGALKADQSHYLATVSSLSRQPWNLIRKAIQGFGRRS